jgi:hypothetical protein
MFRIRPQISGDRGEQKNFIHKAISGKKGMVNKFWKNLYGF